MLDDRSWVGLAAEADGPLAIDDDIRAERFAAFAAMAAAEIASTRPNSGFLGAAPL